MLDTLTEAPTEATLESSPIIFAPISVIFITLSLISVISIPVFAGSYNYDQSSVVVPTSRYMTSSNTNVIWVDYTQDDSDYGYFLNTGTTTITADGKQLLGAYVRE